MGVAAVGVVVDDTNGGDGAGVELLDYRYLALALR
jgi:hypothetical protein